MISSSIFNKPYSDGYPLVLLTVIEVSPLVIIPTVVELSINTSGTKLSTFKYWSKFSLRSTGPLWYSWEI